MDRQTQQDMEYRPYITEEVDKILFTETFKDTFGELGAKETYHELLRLKRREVELHLHGVSLSEYYREKRIPRGFRINNMPTIGRSNQDFCNRWCAALDRCSHELILLVIEETGRELRTVRGEIIQFETDNLNTLRMDKDGDWLNKLQDQLIKYKSEILAFKRSKYLRVQQDYREDGVYRWRHGGRSGVQRRRMMTRRVRKPLGYISSSAESEEEPVAEVNSTQQPFLGGEQPQGAGATASNAEEAANTSKARGRGRPPRQGSRALPNRRL
ncbi:uncharacterized protein LOC121395525 [Xenopus laevis]|uniref:Uncharacterized protein LOC121395524 n=1 Tax=Xenopus laevis TaxID=8355 RepID=A0A8J1L690_XENLA|nr:uncharacterized protein LOC121395524 [Xenopus laevis]XP_041425077.1 uncharacterized protein LOC121395525 [Xenopus laevis]